MRVVVNEGNQMHKGNRGRAAIDKGTGRRSRIINKPFKKAGHMHDVWF